MRPILQGGALDSIHPWRVISKSRATTYRPLHIDQSGQNWRIEADLMASTKTVSPWAHGIVVFTGVIMIVGGAFQALEGLAGVVHDKWLVAAPGSIYAFDLTVWGVIHLLVGLALVVIGVFLLRGQTWARVAGLVVAVVSAIMNFAWLPHSPWWAIMIIVVDFLIIWALAAYLRQPVGTPPQGARAAAVDGQTTPPDRRAAVS